MTKHEKAQAEHDAGHARIKALLELHAADPTDVDLYTEPDYRPLGTPARRLCPCGKPASHRGRPEGDPERECSS